METVEAMRLRKPGSVRSQMNLSLAAEKGCKKATLVIIFMSLCFQVVIGDGNVATSNSMTRPVLIEPMSNETVAVGRDAILRCVVKHLQDYKVAFIHIDRQMILTIHNHVITRIPRFTITHDKHFTWSLKIENVQKEDKGFYMCQVNTDPMVSKVGYLDVVVPPEIIDAESSPSTLNIRENYNASLVCKATGTPEPKITWKREDGKKIVIKRKKNNGRKEKSEVHGEVLDLIRISRTEMGAYLCIARNGVQPAVSKRIIFNVDFAPMIWIPNQLIGAAVGNNVTLECITEAMPKAIAYWVFNGTMVMTAGRFRTHEHHHSNYKLDLKLHIRNIQKEDYGQYKCLSKNSHGDNEGTIMVYELETPTEPPAPQIYQDITSDYEDGGYAVSEDEDEEDEEDYKYNNNFVDSSKDDRNYYGTTNNNKHNSQRPNSRSGNKPSMPEKSKGFWNWEDKGNSAEKSVVIPSLNWLILGLLFI